MNDDYRNPVMCDCGNCLLCREGRGFLFMNPDHLVRWHEHLVDHMAEILVDDGAPMLLVDRWGDLWRSYADDQDIEMERVIYPDVLDDFLPHIERRNVEEWATAVNLHQWPMSVVLLPKTWEAARDAAAEAGR